jgi:hypothetical protein
MNEGGISTEGFGGFIASGSWIEGYGGLTYIPTRG